MNIEIANRLVKLRKEHGLSQEQLADKLGVSRQAVSKWERVEASPDTDNLICLAKLYNMSLDELLNVNQKQSEVDEIVDEDLSNNVDEKSGENESKNNIRFGEDGLHIIDGDKHVDLGKDGIHVIDGDKEVYVNATSINVNKKEFKFYGIISAVLLLLVTVIYILLGCYVESGWEIGRLLFLIVPTVDSIISCIEKKKWSNFAFPILVTGIYVAIGMLANIWHPSWIVFLFIPVFYAIAGVLDKRQKTNDPSKVVKEYVKDINNK